MKQIVIEEVPAAVQPSTHTEVNYRIESDLDGGCDAFQRLIGAALLMERHELSKFDALVLTEGNLDGPITRAGQEALRTRNANPANLDEPWGE